MLRFAATRGTACAGTGPGPASACSPPALRFARPGSVRPAANGKGDAWSGSGDPKPPRVRSIIGRFGKSSSCTPSSGCQRRASPYKPTGTPSIRGWAKHHTLTRDSEWHTLSSLSSCTKACCCLELACGGLPTGFTSNSQNRSVATRPPACREKLGYAGASSMLVPLGFSGPVDRGVWTRASLLTRPGPHAPKRSQHRAAGLSRHPQAAKCRNRGPGLLYLTSPRPSRGHPPGLGLISGGLRGYTPRLQVKIRGV